MNKHVKLRLAILIVLAVVMALIATVCVLYRVWVVKPTLPSVDEDPVASQSGEPGSDVDAVQPKVSGERKSQDYYTILVFGADETSGLTDTMMVVSYDVTNQKASVMSIPRDTLINTAATGISNKQINSVYKRNGSGEEGIAALKNEVSDLVGFVPDYYVKIDWELVGQMVDAIGGVWFDIPYHLDYDDPYQDLYIHFEPGYQYLSGEDAMKVVRWRKNNSWSQYAGEGGGSDINRLNMQHEFLKAVLGQTLQLKNVTKIGELAELFGQNVESDLSIENLFWFGSQAIMGGLNVDDVNFFTMPYRSVDRGQYIYRLYPDQNQLLECINEYLNPFVEEVTIRELDLISVSADGNTLSSSTGVLADPSAGIPPKQEDPDPVDSDPVATPSTDPSQPPEPSGSQEPGTEPSPSPEVTPSPTPEPTPAPTPAPDPTPAPSAVPPAESDTAA